MMPNAVGEYIKPARRGYDLAQSAVERLRSCEVLMTPLNFELWFRAEEYPGSPLAIEIVEIERSARRMTAEASATLAADYLPEYRMAREARESGEQLVAQLDATSKALSDAKLSQNTYHADLKAGEVALRRIEAGPDLRAVVDHLALATARARSDASTLGAQLAAATAEISRLRDHMEVVRRESLTDTLTNLPNRKAFDSALARACATGDRVVVAMLDIDHFKRFNDTWGHATGDQVLKFVGAMIGRTGHAPRLAARYGGEEFAMLFPGETASAVAADLENMLQDIRNRVLTRRTTGESLGRVTVSAGLCEATKAKPTEIMERADQALYASKREGRDRLTFSPELCLRELEEIIS